MDFSVTGAPVRAIRFDTADGMKTSEAPHAIARSIARSRAEACSVSERVRRSAQRPLSPERSPADLYQYDDRPGDEDSSEGLPESEFAGSRREANCDQGDGPERE